MDKDKFSGERKSGSLDTPLDFQRIEAAGEVSFNQLQRDNLQLAVDVFPILERLSSPHKKSVRRQLKSGISHGRKYAETLSWMLVHLGQREALANAFIGSEDNVKIVETGCAGMLKHKNQVRKIVQILEKLEEGLGENSKPGRNPLGSLKMIIFLIHKVYQDAGGLHKPYWNDIEGEYAGPFLTMIKELLDQIGYKYTSRNALGKMILNVLSAK